MRNRQTLERWSRWEKYPGTAGIACSQIVLAAAEGKDNHMIAEALGTDRLLVGKWRKRFAEQGLAGIEKDAPP